MNRSPFELFVGVWHS